MTFEKKKIFILIITVAILTLRVNFTINKTNSFTSMLKPVFAMSKPNQIEEERSAINYSSVKKIYFVNNSPKTIGAGSFTIPRFGILRKADTV